MKIVITPHAIIGPQENLRHAAISMEAQFISEMLKNTGLTDSRESLGGEVGEAQFSSMLSDEYARKLAEQGGIGLADSIFKSLSRSKDGTGYY